MKNSANLRDSEKAALIELWSATQAAKIENLNPKPKKKKKDPYRITKEDGSGTDNTGASLILKVSFVNGHMHTLPAELPSGDTSYENGHMHSFKRTENGSYVILEEHGHIHELDLSESHD